MKWRTPDGMQVEVITLSCTPKGNPGNRDYYIFTGKDKLGDGQWYVVRSPGGFLRGMVRTIQELEDLGVSIGTLEEIKE